MTSLMRLRTHKVVQRGILLRVTRNLNGQPPDDPKMIKLTPPKMYGPGDSSLKPPLYFSYRSQSSGQSSGSSSGGSFTLKLLGFTVVATGGVVIGCYLNDDMRKQVERYVPYSKEAFDTMFSVLNSTKQDLQKKPITQLPLPSPPKAPVESKPPPPPLPRAPPKKDPEERLLTSKTKEKTTSTPKTSAPAADQRPSLAQVEKQMKQEETRKGDVNIALSKKLNTLLQEVEQSTKKAAVLQVDLETKTRQYAEQMKRAMDESAGESTWAAVSRSNDTKRAIAKQADVALHQAQHDLNALREVIGQGMSEIDTRTNINIPSVQRRLMELEYELSNVVYAVHKAESEAEMVAQFRDLIEAGRVQFQQELESILPEVDPKKRGTNKMSEAELNALIAHAHRRIDQLSRRLADAEKHERGRLSSALEKQMTADERLSDERVERELQRLRNLFVVERTSWDAEAREKFEDELRQALARQTAVHSDHLSSVLRAQRDEMEHGAALELRENLLKEREKFHAAIESWTHRVRGIEAAVDGRAELEHQAKEAQELWLACQALLTMLNETNMEPLRRNLRAISDAASATKSGRPFVEGLIAQMPVEAMVEGVYSEEELASRFKKVKRISKRVSMLDETGGSVGMYILSWFQSLFILERSRTFTAEQEVVPGQLDTFTLLSSAEAALRSGDLELAVRFMSNLQGQPRIIAHDWIQDSRLRLEAKQLARALMSFSSARGAGMVLS